MSTPPSWMPPSWNPPQPPQHNTATAGTGVGQPAAPSMPMPKDPNQAFWTGQAKMPQAKRLGVGLLADAIYSSLGMNDETLAKEHMAKLKAEGVVGTNDDQMTEEEAMQWLMRSGYDNQKGARQEVVETGASVNPFGLATNLAITPWIEHFGTPWTGGRKDIMNNSADMVRNVRHDIFGRAQAKRRGLDPDVLLGKRMGPEERFPLNSDREISKSNIAQPFVQGLNQFDASQGYFKGITDYIGGGQSRPVMPSQGEEKKYPARGY
jgi:hypothetical protein